MLNKKFENVKIGNNRVTFNAEIFNGTNELIETCMNREVTKDFKEDSLGGSRDGKASWTGATSKEVIEYLKHGWSGGIKPLKETLKAASHNVGEKRYKTKNSVVGFQPIVPLAIMGLPESMLTTEVKQIKSKVIELYYDCTISAINSSEQILENGQKVMRAVLSLEQAGYRVGLNAIQTYYDWRNADMLLVKVKGANQPLDLKRVLFPMMHPGFFRVVGFGWYERCPSATYRSGYGHALSYDYEEEDVTDAFKRMLGHNAIYMSGREIEYQDYGYIKDQLTERSERQHG